MRWRATPTSPSASLSARPGGSVRRLPGRPDRAQPAHGRGRVGN
jgi:hypothetical protein